MARDRLDHNSQASLAEKAGSLLTDDTFTAYAGEDYEKILVRAMLAISNLMSGGEDATAYALQVSDLQERIIAAGGEGAQENPKLAYKRVALGEYIHGAIDEASRIDYNEAARSWIKVCSWEPDFPFARNDVERAVHGHHSQQGNGVLYIFALVGRGPYKGEAVENGRDDCHVRRQRHCQRHDQAHHSAVGRADQGAQGGRLPQLP